MTQLSNLSHFTRNPKDHSDLWTYRLELIQCGKSCAKCPHGPYWYRYWRTRTGVRKEYVGKIPPWERDPPTPPVAAPVPAVPMRKKKRASKTVSKPAKAGVSTPKGKAKLGRPGHDRQGQFRPTKNSRSGTDRRRRAKRKCSGPRQRG